MCAQRSSGGLDKNYMAYRSFKNQQHTHFPSLKVCQLTGLPSKRLISYCMYLDLFSISNYAKPSEINHSAGTGRIV